MHREGSSLIVHVCSRAVSMHMFFPAWSIVPPCGNRRRSLIWVCWIALFAVRKGCVKVSFVVWKKGQCLCVWSIRYIIEWAAYKWVSEAFCCGS